MIGQYARVLMIALGITATFIGCGEPGFVIPADPSCRTCEIEVTTELSIGESDGPGSLLGRPTYLAMDSLGRFWVSMLDYGFPFVFARDGTFIQQFGQPGEGPGEFRNAWVVEGLPGDSVLLSEGLSYLIAGPDLNIARRVARATVGQLMGLRVRSWPDDVLGLSLTHNAGSQASEAQHLDFSGDRLAVRSTLAPATGSTAAVYRRVEPSGTGDLWVSDVTRYVLRRYGPEGSATDSLERKADWFPAEETFRSVSPSQSPTASVIGLRADPEGRLWVFTSRPRADWQKAWAGRSFPSGAAEVRVSSLPPDYELWSTFVEVIDVAGRRVVVRQAIDGYVFAVLRHDLVATYTELDTGVPVVTVHHLALVEKR